MSVKDVFLIGLSKPEVIGCNFLRLNIRQILASLAPPEPCGVRRFVFIPWECCLVMTGLNKEINYLCVRSEQPDIVAADLSCTLLGSTWSTTGVSTDTWDERNTEESCDVECFHFTTK